MKKIFWTTIFWLIVFFGFAFYIKMFDANMAIVISNRLGATTITTSGEVIPTTGAENSVMSGITTIQTTLIDMQTKLDTLIGGTTTTSTVTPVIETPTTGATK
ncbi:MAG: hypothetical protein WC606_02070 [Candidatus Absconditabacterales bacterium]|jgi:hypothetical protein